MASPSTNPSQTAQLEFFPTLSPSQLDDLKNFWARVIELLYPTQPQPDDQPKTGSKIKSNQKPGPDQEQAQEISKIIQAANHSIQDVSNQLWDWIMMDDPDQMLLKFLKAKKFKSTFDSLKMLFNSLSFRIQRNLNRIYFENNSIANQLRIGKAFIFGFDKTGCPIFRINAAKHKQSDQTPKELEDFVLYSMELTRLFIVPPAQTVTMLVDLSGFGMSNMDWKCTTFMISTLEAHYPETLNFQIIHNAPWIFQGFWKAISTMLDPVVKSKVSFTSKDEDLLKMVDKKYLFKYEGGQSEFTWGIPTNYPIESTANTTSPNPSNGNQESQKNAKVDNDQLNLNEEDQKIKMIELETRQKLIHHFISLTRLWLSLSSSDDNLTPAKGDQTEKNLKQLSRTLKLRHLLKMILRAHYLKLMVYTQPKTIYHYRNILNTLEPGIIRLDTSKYANNSLNDQTAPKDETDSSELAIFGVESARPSLLKSINQELDNLRSEFTIPPPPAADPNADTVAHAATEDDGDLLLNKIFAEISQFQF